MYRLIDGKEDEWDLGKVTPRREKALSDLGIARTNFAPKDDVKSADEVIKEILDEHDEKLQSLIAALFIGRKVTVEELIDVDKIEVQKGVMAFFLADLELMNKYSPLLTTLDSLKLQEKNPQP